MSSFLYKLMKSCNSEKALKDIELYLEENDSLYFVEIQKNFWSYLYLMLKAFLEFENLLQRALRAAINILKILLKCSNEDVWNTKTDKILLFLELYTQKIHILIPETSDLICAFNTEFQDVIVNIASKNNLLRKGTSNILMKFFDNYESIIGIDICKLYLITLHNVVEEPKLTFFEKNSHFIQVLFQVLKICNDFNLQFTILKFVFSLNNNKTILENVYEWFYEDSYQIIREKYLMITKKNFEQDAISFLNYFNKPNTDMISFSSKNVLLDQLSLGSMGYGRDLNIKNGNFVINFNLKTKVIYIPFFLNAANKNISFENTNMITIKWCMIKKIYMQRQVQRNMNKKPEIKLLIDLKSFKMILEKRTITISTVVLSFESLKHSVKLEKYIIPKICEYLQLQKNIEVTASNENSNKDVLTIAAMPNYKLSSQVSEISDPNSSFQRKLRAHELTNFQNNFVPVSRKPELSDISEEICRRYKNNLCTNRPQSEGKVYCNDLYDINTFKSDLKTIKYFDISCSNHERQPFSLVNENVGNTDSSDESFSSNRPFIKVKCLNKGKSEKKYNSKTISKSGLMESTSRTFVCNTTEFSQQRLINGCVVKKYPISNRSSSVYILKNEKQETLKLTSSNVTRNTRSKQRRNLMLVQESNIDDKEIMYSHTSNVVLEKKIDHLTNKDRDLLENTQEINYVEGNDIFMQATQELDNRWTSSSDSIGSKERNSKVISCASGLKNKYLNGNSDTHLNQNENNIDRLYKKKNSVLTLNNHENVINNNKEKPLKTNRSKIKEINTPLCSDENHHFIQEMKRKKQKKEGSTFLTKSDEIQDFGPYLINEVSNPVAKKLNEGNKKYRKLHNKLMLHKDASSSSNLLTNKLQRPSEKLFDNLKSITSTSEKKHKLYSRDFSEQSETYIEDELADFYKKKNETNRHANKKQKGDEMPFDYDDIHFDKTVYKSKNYSSNTQSKISIYTGENKQATFSYRKYFKKNSRVSMFSDNFSVAGTTFSERQSFTLVNNKPWIKMKKFNRKK